MAAAIVQLFLRASASAEAAAFLAVSPLTDMPYGFGICANALAAHSISSDSPANFTIGRRIMAFLQEMQDRSDSTDPVWAQS
jgi:hypothetical protein